MSELEIAGNSSLPTTQKKQNQPLAIHRVEPEKTAARDITREFTAAASGMEPESIPGHDRVLKLSQIWAQVS